MSGFIQFYSEGGFSVIGFHINYYEICVSLDCEGLILQTEREKGKAGSSLQQTAEDKELCLFHQQPESSRERERERERERVFN